jgi:hypothetical protein
VEFQKEVGEGFGRGGFLTHGAVPFRERTAKVECRKSRQQVNAHGITP